MHIIGLAAQAPIRGGRLSSNVRRRSREVAPGVVAYGLQCCMRVEQTDDYREWLGGLKDLAGRARVLMRVDRLIHGNPGDHRNLTDGVSELKIDFGPGYRVYYSKRGNKLLLLLAGGNKSTQAKDIAKAIRLVREYGE